MLTDAPFACNKKKLLTISILLVTILNGYGRRFSSDSNSIECCNQTCIKNQVTLCNVFQEKDLLHNWQRLLSDALFGGCGRKDVAESLSVNTQTMLSSCQRLLETQDLVWRTISKRSTLHEEKQIFLSNSILLLAKDLGHDVKSYTHRKSQHIWTLNFICLPQLRVIVYSMCSHNYRMSTLRVIQLRL